MQDSVIKLGNIGFRTLGFFSSSSWPLCSLKIPRVQEWMAPSVPLGNCLQLYQKLGKRKRQKSYCSNVHKEQIIVFHTPTPVLVIRKRNKTSKVFFTYFLDSSQHSIANSSLFPTSMQLQWHFQPQKNWFFHFFGPKKKFQNLFL